MTKRKLSRASLKEIFEGMEFLTSLYPEQDTREKKTKETQ